jgi:hypothetical protein
MLYSLCNCAEDGENLVLLLELMKKEVHEAEDHDTGSDGANDWVSGTDQVQSLMMRVEYT